MPEQISNEPSESVKRHMGIILWLRYLHISDGERCHLDEYIERDSFGHGDFKTASLYTLVIKGEAIAEVYPVKGIPPDYKEYYYVRQENPAGNQFDNLYAGIKFESLANAFATIPEVQNYYRKRLAEEEDKQEQKLNTHNPVDRLYRTTCCAKKFLNRLLDATTQESHIYNRALELSWPTIHINSNEQLEMHWQRIDRSENVFLKITISSNEIADIYFTSFQETWSLKMKVTSELPDPLILLLLGRFGQPSPAAIAKKSAVSNPPMKTNTMQTYDARKRKKQQEEYEREQQRRKGQGQSSSYTSNDICIENMFMYEDSNNGSSSSRCNDNNSGYDSSSSNSNDCSGISFESDY